MANVIEGKHGRRRGPGPAKGGRQSLVVFGAVSVVVLVLGAYFLMRG